MPNEKILVVDDDTNICELLRLYLEKEGYVVKIVNDGVSAINAFKQENPDLTLLDIMIPKLDGWQVCREIRKLGSPPRTGPLTRFWVLSSARTTMLQSPLTQKRLWQE